MAPTHPRNSSPSNAPRAKRFGFVRNVFTSAVAETSSCHADGTWASAAIRMRAASRRSASLKSSKSRMRTVIGRPPGLGVRLRIPYRTVFHRRWTVVLDCSSKQMALVHALETPLDGFAVGPAVVRERVHRNEPRDLRLHDALMVADAVQVNMKVMINAAKTLRLVPVNRLSRNSRPRFDETDSKAAKLSHRLLQ